MILLDVMLPDSDGFEVCKQLQADARTASIPVVMLSALDREEYRTRSRASGVREYLTKPFDPDQLIKVLNRYAGGEPQKVS